MARGLKIAHVQSDGTPVDQTITSIRTQGSVGGIPQWITGTGGKTIKVEFRDAGGILHTNAYIITQKGSTRFLVANAVGAVEGATHSNANVTLCSLVAGADALVGEPGAVASTMSIVGNTTSGTAFYASRITNKYVYDQSNNKYLYRDSDNAATADFANVVAH